MYHSDGLTILNLQPIRTFAESHLEMGVSFASNQRAARRCKVSHDLCLYCACVHSNNYEAQQLRISYSLNPSSFSVETTVAYYVMQR